MIRLVLFVLVFLLFSCNKDKEIDDSFISGFLNSEEFKSDGNVAYLLNENKSVLDMTWAVSYQGEFPNEVLYFLDIPLISDDTIKLIKYESDVISPSSTFSTIIGHGDVVGDQYELIEEEDNWLYVYERNNDYLKAEASVNLFRNTDENEIKYSDHLPDTLKYKILMMKALKAN